MPTPDRLQSYAPQGSFHFASTHWSVVVVAAGAVNSPESAAALERLCQTYWYPLYAYARHLGLSEHDAKDAVQGTFARILELNSLKQVSSSKGRFRSFLLAALHHYLADMRDRAGAQKRGGGAVPLSIDDSMAEERYQLEPQDERSPDRLFERRWALTLLDETFSILEQEFSAAGKAREFTVLRPFLPPGSASRPFVEGAREIGLTEEAFKKMVQRMRKRCHDILREQVAKTVATPAEVAEELRHLCAILARD